MLRFFCVLGLLVVTMSSSIDLVLQELISKTADFWHAHYSPGLMFFEYTIT